MTPTASALPLAGVRVLDSADLSGALAGRLLAALGADVVLVEPPGGHPTRHLPPSAGPLFRSYAAGKRSVVADPEAVDRLAARADVVITTDAPAAATALAAAHPNTIVTSITPFGHGGPLADWQATDIIAQAMGGMLGVNGHPGHPPLRTLGLQAYHQAGTFAAIGALAALFARERTGRGQLVDVSLQAAVAAALEHVPGLYLEDGTIPRRQGTLHWTRAFRAGRCRDGWVLHSTMGDWTSLAEWVRDDLGEQASVLGGERWDDADVRRRDAEAVFGILDRWSATRDVRSLVDGAQLRRLPYAALARPEALLDDPQLRARDFFTAEGDAGLPFLLDGTRLPVGPAPLPGEHGADVARDWLPAPRRPTRDDAGAPPLDGIDVLDLTWVVAGPVATRVLADLGARVIKVEHPDTPHGTDRRGGLAGSLLRGKESVVLDLRTEADRRRAADLATTCDVVVDNFSARVMPALGLDARTLRHARPDLICVSMTGYGATGPHADRVSYGPTLQAQAGFTALMAERDGVPAGLGYSYSDMASGHMAALAVLAVLWRRRQAGRGASVDFSQLEALAGLLGPIVLERATHGRTSVATGNASQEAPMAPHGVYPAAGTDRWVAITVRCDAEWRRLCEVMGRPQLADDPRFRTTTDRVARADELDALVACWTRTISAREIAERLQAVGIPAGWVADAADLCDHDPQLRARGHFARVSTLEGDVVRLDGSPLRFSETPLGVSRPGPRLGEHTAHVLAERLEP